MRYIDPECPSTSLDLLLAKILKRVLTGCGVVYGHSQSIPRPLGQSWSLSGFPLWTCLRADGEQCVQGLGLRLFSGRQQCHTELEPQLSSILSLFHS